MLVASGVWPFGVLWSILRREARACCAACIWFKLATKAACVCWSSGVCWICWYRSVAWLGVFGIWARCGSVEDTMRGVSAITGVLCCHEGCAALSLSSMVLSFLAVCVGASSSSDSTCSSSSSESSAWARVGSRRLSTSDGPLRCICRCTLLMCPLSTTTLPVLKSISSLMDSCMFPYLSKILSSLLLNFCCCFCFASMYSGFVSSTSTDWRMRNRFAGGSIIAVARTERLKAPVAQATRRIDIVVSGSVCRNTLFV